MLASLRPFCRPWPLVAVATVAVIVTVAAFAAVDLTRDERATRPAQDAAGSPTATDVVLGVHGGAGAIRRERVSDERAREIRDAVTAALEAGHAVLRDGGSSVDAVEAAVVVLEDAPQLNAGRGAVFTSDGHHELEASIMRGADRDAGAVTGLAHIKNPVVLARLVMDRSPHVMLGGAGAEDFARAHGVETVSQDHFFTEDRWRALQQARERDQPDDDSNTVGAVAVDDAGDLAAATSTGGVTNKAPGRIGDSPIIGAATYADDAVAVSTTGTGEAFLRLGTARDVAARVAYQGVAVPDAAEAAMQDVADLGGSGGLIALDPRGHFAVPFTTAGMYRGYVTRDGEITVALFGD